MPDELKLHRKLAQIMFEAERIPKRGKAPVAMGGFDFVQVGDAADYIRRALADHVISMVPSQVEIVGQSEHATLKGGTMTTVELRITWTLTDGETGETAVIQSYGAGADTGDKYSGKAQTSAMKYALLMGFLLSTGDDPEMSDTSDRRARPVATPAPPPHVIAPELGTVRNQDLPRPSGPGDPDGLTGTAEVGDNSTSDFELRQSPDGDTLGFRLISSRGKILVRATGPLATELRAYREQVIGKLVTVWGSIDTVTETIRQRPVSWLVLTATRVRVPGLGDLPLPVEPINVTVDQTMLYTLEEQAELDKALP